MSNLSSGYYNQLVYIGKQINENQKKLTIYKEALSVITKVSSGLPEIENNLSEALDNCLSGAFYVGECLPNNTYGNGAIYDSRNKITDAISKLNILKNDCKSKIDTLERERAKLETAYKNAQINYNASLKDDNK